MEKVIIDIRNSLVNLVNLSKQKYNDNKTELNKVTYETQNKIYNELLKISSVKEMIAFSNALIFISKKMQNSYLELVNKYQSEKDEQKKKELFSQIEIQVSIINAYNESINLINNHLNRHLSGVKTNSNMNNSNEIIDMLVEYISLDPNSSEATELNAKIFNLRDERQMFIEGLIAHKTGKYIFEIESLELRCARLKNVNDIEGEYKEEEFIKLFDENVQIVNEFGFIKEVNEKDVALYNQALRNVKNLLLSLGYDEVFIDEFIMNIIRFNLDGNYQMFENLNGLGFSKKNYITALNNLKFTINDIKKKVKELGRIKVSNKLETFDDLMNRINNIYKEIDNEYKRSLGGESVLR